MLQQKISIVIPSLDEGETALRCLREIGMRSFSIDTLEVILVEAGHSEYDISEFDFDVSIILSKNTGRACQMNEGARKAKGDVLFFLHADSMPPERFDEKIFEALKRTKRSSGCFRLKFEPTNIVLNVYSFFTRFPGYLFHGGDASLFISRQEFDQVGGFKNDMAIMEDYDMVRRLKKKKSFTLLPDHVTTSSRKFQKHGFIRLQLIFGLIHLMYFLGFSQERMQTFYKRHAS